MLYEKNLENWLSQMKWRENPFTLKIDPSLFVGYENQLKRLVNHIREGHKIALITGSTGSGKTTTLKFIERQFIDKYKVLYISKPPTEEKLSSVFLSAFKPSILERLFGVKVDLHNLHVYLNKKLGERKLLVLLDETHEADIDVLKWFRTISDQVNNMQMILAGLSTVDDVLRSNLETLKSRIVTHIELTNLTYESSRELIKKRIESVGGEDIKPFTEGCIRKIYGITGGFPREILKMCDKLVQKAVEEEIFEINEDNVESKSETSEAIQEETEVEEKTEVPERDFMKKLSYKQRRIINILMEEGEMFPSDIAERLGFDRYKSKQHAVRSMNNILKRLSQMGYVDRKPKGKGYVYFLDLKTKNLLIKA